MRAVWKAPAMLLFLGLLVAMLWQAGCDDDDDDDDDDDSGDDDDDNDDNDDNDDDDDNDDSGDDTADYVVPPVENMPPPWPEWALMPWVWEDESTQDSALALAEDYLSHDIPTGAIIIDSPWETGYNTFEFDEDKFPDAAAMIDAFHDLGVRVMMWITPNVNVDSPNYDEGYENGYYVEDGRTYEWWKGEGSLIDYNNPAALAWWHGLMDNVLDLGIDGWKCDGSEFYVYLWLGVDTYTGHISPEEYQALYYGDFFNYTRERLGDDRLITARPVDSYGVPFWGPSFAPVDVNFAGWVGDQDPTWFGLSAALNNMWFSGERGYVNFGSDIGGYRSDDLRDEEVFVRWAQLGALSPVMENGGGGDHRPWSYSDEVLGIYRMFAKLHRALIPYMYSQGATGYAEGVSLYRPLVKWNWHHMLGDWLLVAPISVAGGAKDVNFPEGTWIDWFTGESYEGPSTQALEFPLERYPIFVRKGAVIPLDLRDGGVFDDAGEAEQPPLTVAIYPDRTGTGHEFDLYEESGEGSRIDYHWVGESTLKIELAATGRAYAFRLHGIDKPTAVTVDPHGLLTEMASVAEVAGAESGWTYTDGLLWIKPGEASSGLIITIE